MTVPAVLFLCVHNAGRSQMAAGWLRHLAGDTVDVWSGGSEPAASLNPAAVAAMAEVGIDITDQQPARWSDEQVRAADVVVTMGCGDECPFYPGRRYEDWQLDDPAGLDVAAVRPIRDDIRQRVETLLAELRAPSIESASEVPADSQHVTALAAVRGSRAAVAGLVFSGLFVVSWLLLRNSPSLDDTDATIVEYYADSGNRRACALAGLYTVPFGAIAFIWFLAALRDRYVRSAARENTLLSTVHLIAGALFAASIFVVSATELALVWLAEEADGAIDVSSARAVLALGEANADIMALRSAAVFIAVSSTRAVRSGLFPRAYAVTGLLVAIIMLVVYRSWPATALLVPAWVAVSSIIVLMARPHREQTSGN